jgi:predicted HAD superfamily Cof-like phosphohydrolase
MQSIDQVSEFHRTFGQPIRDVPTLEDTVLNNMREDLLREELEELADALSDRDPVAVLDALTDLQYVLDGAYLSLGFHRYKDAATAEVHRSNMSKAGADGKPIYREDGKILKGPNYSKPDLASILTNP